MVAPSISTGDESGAVRDDQHAVVDKTGELGVPAQQSGPPAERPVVDFDVGVLISGEEGTCSAGVQGPDERR
jgi:hypothetical protein